MYRLALSLIAAAVAAPTVLAQSLVAPPGFAAAEGNSNNSYPWARGASSMRTQFLYDSSTFTSQAVSAPITISRLRFRADGVWATNWSGGTYPQVQITMSSCPHDHLAASATFANNQGANATTVLNGPVTIAAGTGTNPGPWYIDIALTTPFVYYPAVGEDLTVDIQLDGTGWNGGTTGYAPFDAVSGPSAFGTRVFDDTTNTPNGTTGTVATDYAPVCEFTYAPATGLFPAFTATPTSGVSPLQVQFTDLSWSTAPGGVLIWQWDFDGDNVVDSTLPNPTFVYTGCGDFNVSLTVADAAHPVATRTRQAFVQTDRLQASFTKTSLGGGLFQFNDTSTPPALAWAWDFNGDNITDSTAPNPTWAFPLTCTNNTVTLVATRHCRSSTATDTAFAAAASLSGAPFPGNNGHSGNPFVGNLFNIDVTSPDGISVCAITQGLWNFVGPFHADIYVTPTTYVGKDTSAANWRLVASGNGTAPSAPALTYTKADVLLSTPFYLPAGQYGIAVYLSATAGGLMFTSATFGAHGPFVNADLVINPSPAAASGIVKSNLFGNGRFTSRAWNGTLHYTTVTLTSAGGYGVFGLGCAGSAGVTRLTANSAPALGQTLTVTGNNAPSGVAISMLGFSNTTSSFGPLPVDMASFGAPNCFGRVSPDATTLLVGSGGTVTWSMSISTAPWILGVRLYHQMMVLDTATNSLGFVASDAAGMVIGL